MVGRRLFGASQFQDSDGMGARRDSSDGSVYSLSSLDAGDLPSFFFSGEVSTEISCRSGCFFRRLATSLEIPTCEDDICGSGTLCPSSSFRSDGNLSQRLLFFWFWKLAFGSCGYGGCVVFGGLVA